MKSLLFSLTTLTLLSLSACQSSSLSQSANPRTIDLTGAQSRYTVEIPNDQTTTPTDAPYALQGSQASSFTAPIGTGYQAR